MSKRYNFRSFEDAKTYVNPLGLKSQTEWKEYCKTGDKPIDIPTNPNVVYENKGWKGMGDFLGTGNIASKNRTYKPFEDTKTFIKPLGLKSGKEWKEYSKSGLKPIDIPTNPNVVYKNKGWKGMSDFLGNGNITYFNKIYKSFEEAKIFVKTLNLKSIKEWQEYCKTGDKPNDISQVPYYSYKNHGWVNWGDFLGTGNIASFNKIFKSFEDAKTYTKILNLKSQKEWFEYCKSGNKPNNIPSAPYQVYKNKGWNGLIDFLGNDKQ